MPAEVMVHWIGLKGSPHVSPYPYCTKCAKSLVRSPYYEHRHKQSAREIWKDTRCNGCNQRFSDMIKRREASAYAAKGYLVATIDGVTYHNVPESIWPSGEKETGKHQIRFTEGPMKGLLVRATELRQLGPIGLPDNAVFEESNEVDKFWAEIREIVEGRDPKTYANIVINKSGKSAIINITQEGEGVKRAVLENGESIHLLDSDE